MEYISNSIKDTEQFAKQVATNLQGGAVLGLIGNLGAGKTTFTQALGKALGVKQTMTSPTFVLMKIYATNKRNIKRVCHIDAYRLTTPGDLAAIGIHDYLGNPDTVTIIEWADKIMELMPKNIQIININMRDNSRIFEIKKYE